jgi:hypothetical protein
MVQQGRCLLVAPLAATLPGAPFRRMIRSAPYPPWLTQIERSQSQQPLEMRIRPDSGVNSGGSGLLIAGAHRSERSPDGLQPHELFYGLGE